MSQEGRTAMREADAAGAWHADGEVLAALP